MHSASLTHKAPSNVVLVVVELAVVLLVVLASVPALRAHRKTSRERPAPAGTRCLRPTGTVSASVPQHPLGAQAQPARSIMKVQTPSAAPSQVAQSMAPTRLKTTWLSPS